MSKWHGGKGSAPRPIDPAKWDENYERIWGKKEKKGEQAKEGK